MLIIIKQEYYAILKQAKQGNVNLAYQQAKQHKAYRKAKAFKLIDIKGTIAAKDFLITILQKIAFA